MPAKQAPVAALRFGARTRPFGAESKSIIVN
jgi:hypothetical protein